MPIPCSQLFWKLLARTRRFLPPNLRGVAMYPPGHFYSPLLDVRNLGHDGAEYWEHVDLRAAEQRAYYAELVEKFPSLPFPAQRADSHRYFTEQTWFVPSDAFTLSAIIRRERPCRIVEVGSGFSSAVMLDTLATMPATAALTFIEPHPDRLEALLSPADRAAAEIFTQPVQEVPLSVFDRLEAQDLLFIDSSHVAKVGSDVTHLLLRVLPRLKAGVFVHFHDVFYPHSYPAGWLREGRAWNESLFLRAFLLGGAPFRIVAFNSFAGLTFPEVFRERVPGFLKNTGGSLWLRKSVVSSEKESGPPR
jgi:predicted O-methyltransferase YrrM